MPSDDPTTELLESIASYDRDIADRARKFALRIMDEAEDLLTYSNPAMKLQMLRTWMPALARGLAKQEHLNSEVEELKKGVMALHESIRNFIAPDEQDNPPAG